MDNPEPAPRPISSRCSAVDKEGTPQIPLTFGNTSCENGPTIILQLLVKARALNSKSSVGVTHLPEPQVWDTLGMCAGTSDLSIFSHL